MKKLTYSLIAFFSILLSACIVPFSCARTECCVNPEIELAGKFSYSILGCDDSANLELSCTAWFEILNETEARVLPFGDIVYDYNYVVNDDVLTLTPTPVSSFSLNYRFKIIDTTTLEEIDNGAIWVKE